MSAVTPLFDSRYPIVCAAMNQVSDATLAIAVERAGAFPSLSLPCYLHGNQFDAQAYRQDLVAYKEATGSHRLLLSVGTPRALNDAVLRPFLELGFRHIELFHAQVQPSDWNELQPKPQRLQDQFDARVLFKVSTGHLRADLPYEHIVLKGPEGAGRSAADSPPLSEAFDDCRRILPAATLVASGGIGTAADVRDYLDRGAAAVAIGSLFAAARESRIADDVKARIVAAEAGDLRAVGPNRSQGLFQSVAASDDSNLTRTLARGIRDASAGAVFMGRAVDHIDAILPVQEIVHRLMAAPSDA